MDVPFSDHSLVKCDLKTDVGFTPRPVRESRNLRKIDINAFRQDVSSRPFDRVHDLSEVNDMWEFWLEQFLSALDSHAPPCRRRPRNKKSVPWMNAELLRLIARRRKFHKAYIRQSRSAEAYALFSRARAEAHNFNRHLKSEYFLNQGRRSRYGRSGHSRTTFRPRWSSQFVQIRGEKNITDRLFEVP